ncbi:MAG: cytochrome c [Ignavibacteriaceae bacterium]|nr:cytochrome c [Ignavibacteriaceae bacterium]
MTKPQIWVRDLSSQMNNQMSEENTTELTAAQLISNFGCTNCELQGTQMAPALINLSEHWGKETLLNYLRNPNDFMDEARFKEYREKYPNQIMPPYGNKNIKDLGKIVDYLLTK